MANWPSIENPDVFEEETYHPAVRSEFEGNYVQTRPRSSRERGRWRLGWKKMTSADYATLKAFFIANQGLSISWTHPIAATSHTVIFSDPGFKGEWASPGYWKVESSIEEL